MEIRRWYKVSAEPKMENGQSQIKKFAGKVKEFVKGDTPTAVKVAAVGAAMILLPLFLMMTFLLLSSAFFAMLAVRPKRRKGLMFNGRFRRPARIW